jgi:hypothetical protein
VLRRPLFLPIFALVLLMAGCGGVNDTGEPGVTGAELGLTRQISGNWTGKLHQKGQPPFKIAVDIGADSTAQVAYSGIECGGGWTLDGVQTSVPPRYLFTEEIKKGAGGTCKGTGTVSISPIQGNSPSEPAYNQLSYEFSGGGVTSRGLLHRTDPAGIARIFDKAGLQPPPG